ncbi:MAG TPA: hypothetical protein VGL33_22700 [Streptosporangiaceae bacterium]|jgi:hypothetical protein
MHSWTLQEPQIERREYQNDSDVYYQGDPRTTMRSERARKNLDCHPNYILAAYMASGT